MTVLPVVEDLVDAVRYPLGDLESPAGRELVAQAREQLASTGACELPGFLTGAGLMACLADAEALEPLAHRSRGRSTPYLEAPGAEWPDGHPRRTSGEFSLGAVAYDQFPAASPLRAIYEWEPLVGLLAAVLDLPTVFRYADPLGALNLATMIDGDRLQWHYDQTDFVVSLALRGSDEGGAFEVVPRLRDPGDERYPDVARVLAGDHGDVVVLPMRPGTLLVFAGRSSLHRVSPIGGDVSRLVALLGYDGQPGTCSSEGLQRSRYGRVHAG